jgi:hypothetical protein
MTKYKKIIIIFLCINVIAVSVGLYLRQHKISSDEKKFIEKTNYYAQGSAELGFTTKSEAKEYYLIDHRWAQSGHITDDDLEKILLPMRKEIETKKTSHNFMQFCEGFMGSLKNAPESQKAKVADICLMVLKNVKKTDMRRFALVIIKYGDLKVVKENIKKYTNDPDPVISEYAPKVIKKLE